MGVAFVAVAGKALAAVPPIELPPETLPVITVQPPPGEETLYIREYRVVGTKTLPRPEVESAVYSWLGPGGPLPMLREPGPPWRRLIMKKASKRSR